MTHYNQPYIVFATFKETGETKEISGWETIEEAENDIAWSKVFFEGIGEPATFEIREREVIR